MWCFDLLCLLFLKFLICVLFFDPGTLSPGPLYLPGTLVPLSPGPNTLSFFKTKTLSFFKTKTLSFFKTKTLCQNESICCFVRLFTRANVKKYDYS